MRSAFASAPSSRLWWRIASFVYLRDGLGSVVQLTDSTGTVMRSYLYDSFGGIASEAGTLANPYVFTGRERDAESGFYFYRARYYDPAIGRFLAEDPLGLGAGEFNIYRYVANNPILLSDPSGLDLVLLGTGASINLGLGFETSFGFTFDTETFEIGGVARLVENWRTGVSS